jgi:hypothetical protein
VERAQAKRQVVRRTIEQVQGNRANMNKLESYGPFLRTGKVTARIIVPYSTALMSCRFHLLVQGCPARRAS